MKTLLPQPFLLPAHPNYDMVHANAVVSLNPDTKTLLDLEVALREIGFKVLSVSTPIQARFEIEMGTCGILLASYVMSIVICRDLIGLFRSRCPSGLVIFLRDNGNDILPEADVVLSSRDDPKAVALKIASMTAKAS